MSQKHPISTYKSKFPKSLRLWDLFYAEKDVQDVIQSDLIKRRKYQVFHFSLRLNTVNEAKLKNNTQTSFSIGLSLI